jgi:hypothetical protein
MLPENLEKSEAIVPSPPGAEQGKSGFSEENGTGLLCFCNREMGLSEWWLPNLTVDSVRPQGNTVIP